MSGHPGLSFLPATTARLVAFAACLALGTGCTGKPDAKASAGDQAPAAAGSSETDCQAPDRTHSGGGLDGQRVG